LYKLLLPEPLKGSSGGGGGGGSSGNQEMQNRLSTIEQALGIGAQPGGAPMGAPASLGAAGPPIEGPPGAGMGGLPGMTAMASDNSPAGKLSRLMGV